MHPLCSMPQQPLQAQRQPGHPRQAPKAASTSADPTEPTGLQQSCIFQRVTDISSRKKAQASTGFGLQEARAASEHWGRRLLVSPAAKKKKLRMGSRMHVCAPHSGEGQLAANLSSTAKLSLFNPNLV